MEDINKIKVKQGDIILIPIFGKFNKHVFIKKNVNTVLLTDYINFSTDKRYWWRDANYNRDINEHNGFIYKQYMPDFIIIGHKNDFNRKDYKSIKQLKNE